MRVVLLLCTMLLAALGQAQILSTPAEQFLFQAANVDRAAQGLPALRLDAALSLAARRHALAMAAHATIAHQFADEPGLAERAAAAGTRFSRVAENVADGPDATELHTLWMHSPGHRANLLDAQVDAVGIAVVRRGGLFYAVEDFARTTPQLSLGEQERSVASSIARAGVPAAADADARATCGQESGYRGARRPEFVMRYTTPELASLPPELSARLLTGRYHSAAVGACAAAGGAFSAYSLAVLLYR